MNMLTNLFKKKVLPKPAGGFGAKCKNILSNNSRGIIGFLVPFCLLIWQGKKGYHFITVKCMWLWMFWFYLIQPVNIPVTGMIPIFLLPMAGVLPSALTCSFYLNEGMILYMLSNMLLLLMNNSGVDRRIAVWALCSGDNCQFSGHRLLIKCCATAFFLSMFSNRLIITSILTQYVTPAFNNLQASTSRDVEPCFEHMHIIVCCAIQICSAIGSIAIIHASLTGLAFRTIFYESVALGMGWPDIFNYFQYIVYAFPVALLMLIINLLFFMLMMNWQLEKTMSLASMSRMRDNFIKYKNDIPVKVTLHEKLSVFFTLFYLTIFITRWSKYLNMGWGDFRIDPASPANPVVKDATVAAIFVVFLHALPKGFSFWKFTHAEKRSELDKVLKPESGILWWRFVDKNMNYGYMFLIGSGVAISMATRLTGLDQFVTSGLGTLYTQYSLNTTLFLICLTTIILTNIMTAVAVVAIFLPFVMNMGMAHVHLGALAVGLGAAFGFVSPFLYTPAYFCHYTGKIKKMSMFKYSLGSLIICLLILWLSLIIWAPIVWGDGAFTPITSSAVYKLPPSFAIPTNPLLTTAATTTVEATTEEE